MTGTQPEPVRQLFAGAADEYDRFMGRFSEPLAPLFADFAGLQDDMRVADVGCGPGALTAELAARVGAHRVAGVDPAAHFVAACRARVPGADIREGTAEHLPWEDGSFGAALSQLVFGFIAEPDLAVAEMRRVVQPGGVIAASMWAAGKMALLGTFWGAASSVAGDGADAGEHRIRLRTREEWEQLTLRAGLEDVRIHLLEVEAHYTGFDDFWASVETAVGPIALFLASLDDERRERVSDECRRRLGDPSGSFTLPAAAWALRGTT